MARKASNKKASDNHSLIGEIALQIVEQLSSMYEMLKIGKTAEDFKTEFFEAMLNDPELDPNFIEDEIENSEEVSNIDLIRLSCAYVAGALNSKAVGNQSNAWLGISHAQYWMGVAWGMGFIKGAFSQRAKAGVAKRDEQYEKVRKHARELAEAGRPNGEPFPSRRQAVLAIQEQVVAFSVKNLTKPLKKENAFRTIDKWLSGMQFAGKL